jgi:hypothetical protein
MKERRKKPPENVYENTFKWSISKGKVKEQPVEKGEK